MNNLIKNIFVITLVFLVLAFLFNNVNISKNKVENINLSQLSQQIKEGKVDRIEVDGSNLNIVLKDGSRQTAYKEQGESIVTILSSLGVESDELRKVSLEIKKPSQTSIWFTAIIPTLLPLIIIGFLIYFMAKQVQGFNQKALTFSQSAGREVRRGKDRVTFKDVAGAKEAKEELMEIVDFLKGPDKFISFGAKVPKGVLLVGPPGTGKTLLAKAVAGEADVPFISISGSEFVEMFVGVGAARVRSLFQKAKKQAPSIIFIDEIDAVGRRRGAGLGGSHDEREQTLNQILVEMDGFDTKTNVIVMAATNRPDVLDPALLRPGRFDRRVVLDLPDINEREEILKIHAANKPLSDDVDLRRVAERTSGFSGADLANLLNEAAILAVRRGKKKIEQEEVLESIEKVMLGPERKSRVLSEQEKKITAYHEAGHALVAHSLPHTDPVHKVSIVSRGSAGGYTLNVPEQDKRLHSRQEFIERISVMLAGHAAEKVVFGDVTTGASNDLERATSLAKSLVTRFGMSEKLGPRTFGESEEFIFLGKEIHEQRDYSEETAKLIDMEVSSIISHAYNTAKEIIKKRRKDLENIVDKLLKEETIEKEEFEKIVGPKATIQATAS